MKVIDWSNANVPKYASPDKWALTGTEKLEVTHTLRPTGLFYNIEQPVIQNRLVPTLSAYEARIGNDFNIFKSGLLGEEERRLVSEDSNAFLIGLIADQSVKAELAWSLPYRLGERLGEFNINTIANMNLENLTSFIKEKPALHRYPANMAKYIQIACKELIVKYNSTASNIWAEGTPASEIIRRLEVFKGISHKKAALGVLLLVRDFGINVTDKQNINLAYEIHIRRVCLRTGLAQMDTPAEIHRIGRNIFPDFPGRLTSIFWAIGRDFCRPTSPNCSSCPISSECAKKIELGNDIKG